MKPRNLLEQSSFAIEQLMHLFKCRIQRLLPSFFKSAHESQELKKITQCIKKNSIEKCQELTQEVCRRQTKLVKTIRFSLRSLLPLINNVPTLKVVYLVRDPRGIMNSRLHSPFLKKISTKDAAHAICDRYKDDFKILSELNLKRSRQVKMVLYEDLIKSPLSVAKDLYSFLNLTYRNDIGKWLLSGMSSNKTSGYYGTLRANASVTGQKWRSSLSKGKKTEIDNICGDLYKDLHVV